jgi:hypothetical protein
MGAKFGCGWLPKFVSYLFLSTPYNCKKLNQKLRKDQSFSYNFWKSSIELCEKAAIATIIIGFVLSFWV